MLLRGMRGMRGVMMVAWLSWLGASSAFVVGCAPSTPQTLPGGPSNAANGDDPSESGDGSGGDGGTSKRDPKGPSVALEYTRNVRIIVEPSDTGSALRAALRGAKKSIHMTMYLLTASSIIDALIDKKQAGIDVKVVLNRTFPSSGNDNQDAYAKLTAANVPVAWAPATYQYTHSKTIVIDDREAWIMTMNATYSAPTDNREFLAVDTDADDVAQAEKLFQADFANRAVVTSGKLVVSPTNSRDRLTALIQGAEESIDVEVEAISDDRIVDALIAAKERGITLRVVIDAQTGTAAQQEAVGKFKAAGVPIVSVSKPSIHSKAIVVDSKRAYTGSINFTTNSLMNNRELGVLFDAPAEVGKLDATIAADFQIGQAL